MMPSGTKIQAFDIKDTRPGAAATPLRCLQFLGHEANVHGLPLSRDRRSFVLALSLNVKLRARRSHLRGAW
jgi:hypothetical protein